MKNAPRHVALSLAVALLAGWHAAGAAPRPASAGPIVLLPLANIAGAQRAPAVIETAIAGMLSEKGYRVVRGEEVRAFLASERVRYVDSLSGPVRERLLAKFSARGALLGAVCAFEDGENPIVGITLRLVNAAGGTAWSNAVGLTGDDTEGALALSRIATADRLAEKAVLRLVRGFPAPGETGNVQGARGGPIGKPAPRTYRSVELVSGSRHRVCILPLANRSRERVASRLVGELLARRLAASELFEVVEPAEFRGAMVAAKLPGLKNGDPAELARLGGTLGTGLFLTGTVFRYLDTSAHNGGVTPELEMQLTLTDVSSGRIVWTSALARKGTDYAGLLQLGAMSSMTSLADQMAAEMIRAAEKTRGKSTISPARAPAMAAASRSSGP